MFLLMNVIHHRRVDGCFSCPSAPQFQWFWSDSGPHRTLHQWQRCLGQCWQLQGELVAQLVWRTHSSTSFVGQKQHSLLGESFQSHFHQWSLAVHIEQPKLNVSVEPLVVCSIHFPLLVSPSSKAWTRRWCTSYGQRNQRQCQGQRPVYPATLPYGAHA